MSYLSTTQTIERLEALGKSGERLPHRVLDLGIPLLQSGNIWKVGDRAWQVIEQITVAAIDLGNYEIAKNSIKELEKKFAGSLRIERLKGLLLESTGKVDEAKEKYNQLLDDEPTNTAILKRKIAILMSQNKIMEAIKALVSFVDIYSTDTEAWIQLCLLYLNEHMYTQAAFCVEELIIQKPDNHFYHLKYAEIQYSLGNTELALKYFLRAVELCKDNIRGLYGMKLCAKKLLADSKTQSKSRKSESVSRSGEISTETLSNLSLLAAERLHHCYSSYKQVNKFSDEIYEKSDMDNALLNPTPMCKLVVERWLKL